MNVAVTVAVLVCTVLNMIALHLNNKLHIEMQKTTKSFQTLADMLIGRFK
jgi:hypothetical protein